MYRYGVALIMLALVLTACAGGGGQAPTVVVGGAIPVGNRPSTIAVSEGAVWVALRGDDVIKPIMPVK